MSDLDRRKFALGLAMIGITAACARNSSVQAQSGTPSDPTLRVRPNLYACEGCEATHERDPEGLLSTARLADPDEPGERMRLVGTVFEADGVTPAEGVVIYAHHTNDEGLYANGTNETEWSRRHGRLRGWVRTGVDGSYAFDTIKPGVYPNGSEPAHIHLFLQERGRPPYYIDDVVFAGEFGVDADYRSRQELRGGSGIIRLDRSSDGAWLARRDIRLELHPD